MLVNFAPVNFAGVQSSVSHCFALNVLSSYGLSTLYHYKNLGLKVKTVVVDERFIGERFWVLSLREI